MTDILFERRGGLAIATLNRPQALNAMTLAMYRAFAPQLAAWQRVATDSTLFAMPEVLIGSIPDVGATRFFGRCPGRLGLYLALTGARIGAADAMSCGLFTHYVPDAHLAPLTDALAALDWIEGEERAQIEAVLARFGVAPGGPALAALRPAIDRCFERPSVETIVESLNDEGADWARAALDAMGRASPTSLKIVFQQMHRGAGLELEGALTLEYRLIQHLLRGSDFYEGVRSVVIDKDRSPRWRFGSLADVSDAEVERYFEPIGGDELVLD